MMLQAYLYRLSQTLYFLLLSVICLTQSQWVMYPKANPSVNQVITYYPRPQQPQPYQPPIQQTYQPVVQQPYQPTVQPYQPQNPNPTFPSNDNFPANNGLQPNQAPIVPTSRGRVRGKAMLSEKGFQMFAYFGVPYAERPSLFQRSEPKRPWTGIYDSSELGPGCAAGDRRPGTNMVLVANGTSTDCLFLKILVPAQRNAPLPVLFWPHGGGFTFGSNGNYNSEVQGDNIVSKGVILAQPNYRTGAMGFWSSGSPDAPGNYGMWDVFNSLQFVKREIANFGGDPNRITLMGQGAGAVANDAMTLSPLTRGVYSKAALLSGSIFQPNVNVRPTENDRVFRTFARAANCDDQSNSQWNSGRRRDIVQCLRSKTPQDLLQAQSDANLDGSMTWHPVVDGNGGILPLPFDQLAQQRPIFPVLMGATNEETAWDLLVTPLFATRRLEPPNNINQLNSREEVVRQCDSLISEATFDSARNIRELCKVQFGNEEDQTRNSLARDQYYWLNKAIETGSSFTYFAPIHKDLSFHLQKGNRQAYLYSLDYFREQAGPWWQLVKAFHNFDIAYIESFFPQDIYKFRLDNRDLYMQDLLTGMITNFAKTGNPSITTGNQPVRWDPLSLPQGYNYLSLNIPPTMEQYFHMDDVIFWNQLVPLGISSSNATPFSTNPGFSTPPLSPGIVRPFEPNQPLIPPIPNAFPRTNPPYYPNQPFNPPFPNTPQPFNPPFPNTPFNPAFPNPNQPPNSVFPNNPNQPPNSGGFQPYPGPNGLPPNLPSNFGPHPAPPPPNGGDSELSLQQVLNNGLEFIRNFLPPLINSIASATETNPKFGPKLELKEPVKDAE